MSIGTHLASLNLFREQDGTVEITVAGTTPEAQAEFRKRRTCEERPVDYIENLIVEAAERIKSRRASQPG